MQSDENLQQLHYIFCVLWNSIIQSPVMKYIYIKACHMLWNVIVSDHFIQTTYYAEQLFVWNVYLNIIYPTVFPVIKLGLAALALTYLAEGT